MMGQHDRSEALFYYFRLEDQVPENHLLRLIEKHISFAFVREKLKEAHDTNNPEKPRRHVTVLHAHPIKSPQDAVRAAIIQEFKSREPAEES